MSAASVPLLPASPSWGWLPVFCIPHFSLSLFPLSVCGNISASIFMRKDVNTSLTLRKLIFILRLCTTEMSLIYSATQLLACLTILGCNIFTQNFEGLLYSFLTSKVALAKHKPFLFLILWLILDFLSFRIFYAWGLPISQKSSLVWDFSSSLLGNLFNVKAHFLRYNILVIFFFPLNNFDFIIFSVLFEWHSDWFDIGLLIFVSLFSISSFPLLMLTFLLLLSRSKNLLNLLAFSCLLLLF